MKYGELINFESITSVIQLRDSEDSKMAKELVQTYVISELMGKKLCSIVFPLLKWGNAIEHFGMLVVGNYGTGKSHLMSVIASIAADASLVQYLRNAEVREEAKSIAGKFKVIRFEMGGVRTEFRTIFVNALQNFLDQAGVDYEIPPEDGLTNNRGWLEAMMAAFEEQFPGQGLLMVIDEMLAYLSQLDERELIRAFELMREIGEFSKNSRFRFIGGVQEMIFTSPRFQFVAESLRRVNQRFSTISIERSDIKCVVEERLLGKTAESKEFIRKHLEKFAPCYETMASQMDEYCRMFPVHPNYIDVFERISVAEHREVLKTLSKSINDLLDKDVPENAPGLISFDSYWEQIKSTPHLQANENIKIVTDCSKVLDAKVSSLPKIYRDLAQRVISALSIHRLTTPSINDKIGLTASNIRDMLCIYDPIIEAIGEDKTFILEQNIEEAIAKLKEAVAGQYITRNNDNKQYYIDVEKTIDVEENINVHAKVLSNEELDRAYFEVLKIAMEVQDVPTKLSGVRIWEFEDLKWLSHKAPRNGYLFFGSPNERSTAQPPRDYYLYFLRPFNTISYKDEKKEDEIFFKLTDIPDEIKGFIRYYAAAIALKQTSSDGELRQAYIAESVKAQRKLIEWLFNNAFNGFEVIYKGVKKKASSWLTGVNLRQLANLKNDQTFNFRESILALSGYLFEDYFQTLAPNYPIFEEFISKTARVNAIKDTFGVLAGGRSRQGLLVLKALKLLDGSNISLDSSLYVQKLRDMLKQLADGHVLSRDKLIQVYNHENYFDLRDSRLEEIYFLVLLAALVANGEIVLHTLGHEYGAADIAALSSASVDDLLNFSHISKPRDFAQETLVALFDLFGLDKGSVTKVLGDQKEPVVQLQTVVNNLIRDLAYLLPKVTTSILFLGIDLLDLTTHGAGLSKQLSDAKSYLERLRVYDTPAKLKNFRDTPETVSSFKTILSQLQSWKKLLAFKDEKSVLITYLSSASNVLGIQSLWSQKFLKVKEEIKVSLTNAKDLEAVLTILDDAGYSLSQLKKEYINEYLALHKKARLSAQNDVKRQNILNGTLLAQLEKLAVIDLLPKHDLLNFRNKLQKLVRCEECHPVGLEQEASCVHCHYMPSSEGGDKDVNAILQGMEDTLSNMLERWTSLLNEELKTATAQENLNLLKSQQKQAVLDLIERKEMPMPIPEDLIEALKEVLNGLTKVTFDGNELMQKLRNLGPVKVAELQGCFKTIVDEAIAGKEYDKVRLVIE